MQTLPPKKVYITEGREMRAFALADCLPDDIDIEEILLDTAKGDALPDGLTLDDKGVIRGVPRMGASVGSPYQLMIDINDETCFQPIELRVGIQMNPEEIAKRQLDIWRAYQQGAELPQDFIELLDRPITKLDVYHLVERFASFTVWNADDLALAKTGRKIKIRDVSEKYQVYDFDVCLVATPKDLYASDRSLTHALHTAKAMVREAHRRRWHVEFGGFDKMAMAAWYEVNNLNSRSRHKMAVRNYTPPAEAARQTMTPDVNYNNQEEPE